MTNSIRITYKNNTHVWKSDEMNAIIATNYESQMNWFSNQYQSPIYKILLSLGFDSIVTNKQCKGQKCEQTQRKCTAGIIEKQEI